mmetsp:Transcript_12116/g.18694  ORF Transcript_12116/g.18694 Transcript_12116/m.18694 type:complete len:503 (-) Transcript_12116:107-1615(-)
MKLSSALATLIAFQRHGHSIWASADERKLLLNQADAAKRVDDIVKTAMASADAGDVHGVALPLNYVVLSANEGKEQQLSVALRLPGVERDQNVMIDTGSSSLAFCDNSLVEEAVNITKTDYAQCNTYSGDSCPDDPSSDNIFYVGQVFKGNITAYNTNTDKDIASMDEVYFVISSKVQGYFCDGPLNGIIGVAYSGLNKGVNIPSPDFNILSLWNESCQVDNKSVGSCTGNNMTKVPLPAPLEQILKEDDESGYISAEAFGLYCDYAATIGSKVDTIVPSLGIFFGGDMALNNTFYNGGTPQVAAVGNSCVSEYKWYTLKLTSIRVPALNMTQSGFGQCDKCGSSCFTDSGYSSMHLPLPASRCNDLMNTKVDILKNMGSLLLDIVGKHGNTITLSLPLVWLAEQAVTDRLFCSGTSGDFILGFPTFQHYYIAYDMKSKTVTFVDLPLSNETEAFINGPELGGINESPSSGTTESPSSGNHVHSTIGFLAVGSLLLAFQYIS